MSTPGGQFAKLPLDVLARRDLRPAAKLVYAAIADAIGGNGKAWPGYGRLGMLAGLPAGTVKRAVGELVAAGLLVKTPRGRGRSNVYVVGDNRAQCAPTSDLDNEANRAHVAPTSVPDDAPNRAQCAPRLGAKCATDRAHGAPQNQTNRTRPSNQRAAASARAGESPNGNGEADAYRVMLERNSDHLAKSGQLRRTREAYIAAGVQAAAAGRPWAPLTAVAVAERLAGARELERASRQAERAARAERDVRTYFALEHPELVAEAKAAGLTDAVEVYDFCKRRRDEAAALKAREAREAAAAAKREAAEARAVKAPPIAAKLIERFEAARKTRIDRDNAAARKPN